MIIKTRYRDIPWEEVKECFKVKELRPEAERNWESVLRGKDIHVVAPGVLGGNGQWACDGPFYWISGQSYGVCPHIAEIGD